MWIEANLIPLSNAKFGEQTIVSWDCFGGEAVALAQGDGNVLSAAKTSVDSWEKTSAALVARFRGLENIHALQRHPDADFVAYSPSTAAGLSQASAPSRGSHSTELAYSAVP
jgi:hypothetical protein